VDHENVPAARTAKFRSRTGYAFFGNIKTGGTCWAGNNHGDLLSEWVENFSELFGNRADCSAG
jgi:hypothetical protein